MDKNEYRAKLDEINDLVDQQDYKGALKIVDTIDWRRVRSARTLCMVGEIYEANKRYPESRKLLLMAHQRAPIGRTVLYRLVELSIKMGNFDEAADYYKQFVEISPNDNSRYILKYKIYRAKRSPIEEQISILQEYKSREYTERWAYELARLYAKAGMKEACIEECDDLILWFSEGKYVTKAMELKMKYIPLSRTQQEKYDNRFTNTPSAAAAAAASAVSAAAQAAAKVVQTAGAAETAVDSGDQELEDILKSIAPQSGKAEASSSDTVLQPDLAQMPEAEELKSKAAQDIMGVFGGRSAEEQEAAATQEAPSKAQRKDYVVKELEPENLGATSEFKPFHLGKAMTMEVKAQAPQSKPFKVEDLNPEAFRTDFAEKELDLEALLAETANELAQAVAEETENQQTTEMPAAPQEEPESGEQEPETSQSQTEETISSGETKEAEQINSQAGLVAPAAAKAAMVADNIAAALEAKAAEFENTMKETGDVSGDTREIVLEEIPDTESRTEEPVGEAIEEETVPVTMAEGVMDSAQYPEEETNTDNPEISEHVYQEEDLTSQQQEAAESAAEQEDAEENLQEQVLLQEEEETEENQEVESQVVETETEEESASVEEAATKVIPVDEVKASLEQTDFAKALEEQLSDTVFAEQDTQQTDQQDEGHMKRVTASVASESGHKAAAFQTAVEGLMRHHLTEEEHRRLFTYFVPVPGMRQQITEILDTAQESACAKTSQAGNIIVTGREGSGKTRLSEGLIKALCKERQMKGAKSAFIEAEELNKKDPVSVVDKMSGGFLVVEHAGSLNPEVVENMSKAMEFKTNRLTVILEDLKAGIRELDEKYPEFMKKFDSRIVIPVFTNDELVSFAKTYAKELGYKIDDMAVLALYTLIGDNQNEENPVSIEDVREMMDESIKKASRKGRRPGKRVAKRHLDESGRIMLYEKDFDI